MVEQGRNVFGHPFDDDCFLRMNRLSAPGMIGQNNFEIFFEKRNLPEPTLMRASHAMQKDYRVAFSRRRVVVFSELAFEVGHGETIWIKNWSLSTRIKSVIPI